MRVWRRALQVTVLTLVCLPALVLAYVSPGKAAGYVNDFAGVLSPEIRTQLEQKLKAYDDSSTNQIAVVTVKSLEGDTVENVAVKLFEEWGIGKKGKDNGVLLLVAMDDREMRIEVGYGLEGSLTDAQSAWIIRNIMVPAFRSGDYNGGVTQAVDKIIEAASGGAVPEDTAGQSAGSSSSSFDYFWLFFAIPMWLGSILSRSKSWWAGGVIGAIAGVIVGVIYGFMFSGLAAVILLTPLGLLFDFIVSKSYAKHRASGVYPWWIGGGRGGFGGGTSSGGFGGFGGGFSGGGGASGRW